MLGHLTVFKNQITEISKVGMTIENYVVLGFISSSVKLEERTPVFSSNYFSPDISEWN